MAGLLADGAGGEVLAPGIHLWRAALDEAAYLATITELALAAPWRHMSTPGGRPMSVAMTNCGEFGWVSGARGYRYERTDPDSGRPWPRLPPRWRADARALAEKSGFMNFEPDACLVNRYAIGARMTAHQDRNEIDYTQPIVSVSLGLPATFAFHGAMRSGPARTVHLNGGDVLVWGGPARLDFHAVRAVKPGLHAVAGPYRYNITFRRAAA